LDAGSDSGRGRWMANKGPFTSPVIPSGINWMWCWSSAVSRLVPAGITTSQVQGCHTTFVEFQPVPEGPIRSAMRGVVSDRSTFGYSSPDCCLCCRSIGAQVWQMAASGRVFSHPSCRAFAGWMLASPRMPKPSTPAMASIAFRRISRHDHAEVLTHTALQAPALHAAARHKTSRAGG